MKSQIKRFSKSTLSVILSLCMLVSCMTVGLIATDAAYDDGESVGGNLGEDHEFRYSTLYINASSCSNFDTSGFAYSFTANDTNWGTWVSQDATNIGGGIYSFDLSGIGSYEWLRTFRIHSKTGTNSASDSGALMTPPNGNTRYNCVVLDSNGDGTWATYVPSNATYYVRGSAGGLSWDSGSSMSATGTIRYKYVSAGAEFKIVTPDNWVSGGGVEFASYNNSHDGADLTLTTENNNVKMPSAGYICFDTTTQEIYARSTDPSITNIYFKYDQTGGTTTKGLNGTAMTYDSTLGLYKLSVNLNRGSNENWYYIVVYDSSESHDLSYNNGTISETLRSGSGFKIYDGDNNVNNPLHIVASVTGIYNFYFDSENNELYVECPHTVTFDSKGGTSVNSQVVTYGGKATRPTSDPTKTGYTFNNWVTTDGGSTAFNFSTTTITEDTTIYAKWTQNNYTISYPSTNTGYTLGGTKPTSAKYNNNVSFTVTPLAGYRIDSVQYTPEGGSATDCIAGDNNEYHFAMPNKNVAITVNMIQTCTVTLTAATGFASKQYKIGDGSYKNYSAPFTVDKGSVVTFKVTYSNGYEYDSVQNATPSSNKTIFTTAAINSNITVTIKAKKSTYSLNGVASPSQGGTVTFYTNYNDAVADTNAITSAQINNTVYAKFTPESNQYTLSNFTKSGSGLSNLTGQADTNIVKFTMGYSDATITANVVATTPTFLGTWSNVSNVIAGRGFTYNGHGTVTPDTSTYTYSFNGSAYQSSPTFTAPTAKGTYTLIIKATNSPAGVSAVSSTKSVSVTVIYDVHSVTYYVDMHDNRVDSLSFAVVESDSDTSLVIKDNDNDDCIATLGDTEGKYKLEKQGNSTVYAASINTPLIPSGSGYSALKFKVTYNGTAYTKELASNQVSDLYEMTNKEIWLEAVNESSQTLSIKYSTAFEPASGSTPAVAEGNRRIYLARPYNWCYTENNKLKGTDTDWQNIGVYHWGDYSDILWNNGVHMNYLGYGKMPGAEASSTDKYHFYYVDLPKAINGNKVQNIIFQGWGTNTTAGDYTKAQTGNIEEIPDSANFFVLSKDGNAYSGTMAEENVKIPTFARHADTVAMNVGESGVSIAPDYTGAKVTYTSGNTSKVTVSSTGVITPVASTITNGTDTPVTITVKVYGSIGAKISDTSNGGGEPSNGADAVTYTVRVSVHDPSKFNGFNIMSIESDTYTVSIPNVGSDQPGYFDMGNEDMEFTVTGLLGVSTSKTSSVITPSSEANPNSFTVKYAKKNTMFSGYNDIEIVGKIVTKSILHTTTGNRYGITNWLLANNTDPKYTISKVINNGTETATTIGVNFTNSSSSTFRAVFESYVYVDVTFTFTYYEYKPKVDEDGMINYPYDANYAGTEDRTSTSFNASTHTLRTVTVQNYEVRGKTATNVQKSDLVTPALAAIGVLPTNNYYKYSIAADDITISDRNTTSYSANATVDMSHSVKEYKVYLNGKLIPRNVQGDSRTTYYYQEYAELKVEDVNLDASKNYGWYAVNSSAETDTSNSPLLATGTSYKFRVKGNTTYDNNEINRSTYIRVKPIEGGGDIAGSDFIRSEVDFSHYEVIHRDNPTTTQVELVEYLLQNFYIADFFSPANVLDPNSNNGQGNLPYDDAQFVGGGVVYYSMNGVTENSQGTPFANAVSAGYVNGDTESSDYGKINSDAIKEMLKTNIEAQYAKDSIAGTAGEETAMKVAYGTEIAAKKNVEGGFNTGIIYRYLPLNQYKRDAQGKLLNPDEDGDYAYDVNTNTFRYSNTLQSYQYVYASGNENKTTNAGKNMRLYSYYVYSYVAYNQETNVPETKYEIVLSDNYSDASTYWAGNPNPNPAN